MDAASTSDADASSGRRGRPRVGSWYRLQVDAVAYFLAHGYDQTSADDLAAGLGVGRSTLFRYFGSKSGVVWRDYDKAVDLLPELLAEHAGPSAIDTVHAAVLAMSEQQQLDWGFVRQRYQLVGTSAEIDLERARINARFAQTVASFVREHAASVPHPALPDALAGAIVAALVYATRDWSARGGRPTESLAAVLDGAVAAVLAAFRPLLDG